jgi:hypothetical protein
MKRISLGILWRWAKRLVTGVVALVLLLLMLAGVAYQAIASARDARRYPPPGRLIDVGGYFPPHRNTTSNLKVHGVSDLPEKKGRTGNATFFNYMASPCFALSARQGLTSERKSAAYPANIKTIYSQGAGRLINEPRWSCDF